MNDKITLNKLEFTPIIKSAGVLQGAKNMSAGFGKEGGIILWESEKRFRR